MLMYASDNFPSVGMDPLPSCASDSVGLCWMKVLID